MKILVAAVSGASFNHTLHYRYADVGEVLGFLAAKRPDDDIEFYDSLSYEIDWNLLRAVASGVERLVFFADVASAPATFRLARMSRELEPDLPIMVYGKATLRLPRYFTRSPFDGVYLAGDQEAAILSYLDYLEGGAPPSGVWVSQAEEVREKGIRLAPSEWGFPLLSKLPLDQYRRIAKAKGIPFELSVYASKGCPHRECDYCDAWMHEGFRDRRRDPETLLFWTDKAVQEFGFDCVQMHSTNFCADPQWLDSFCEGYRATHCRFTWTCCTRPDTLTRDMIRNMAAAGCLRIGIGIENLPFASPMGLKASVHTMEQLSGWIEEAGIACKAYIMAGMPGQTELDLLHTYQTCLRMKFIPRLSTYTPFQELSKLSVQELDRLNLALYDRKSFFPETDIPFATILKLILRAPGVEQWARQRYERLLQLES